MNGSFQELQLRIRDAIREKVLELFSIYAKDGAIRIAAHPLTEDEDDWYGGLSDFETGDIVEYETVFTILPRGSHTKTFANTIMDTYGVVKVNCYGYSALKVADCALAVEMTDSKVNTSGTNAVVGDLSEEYGYAHCKGAVCYSDEKCRIYISVSGFKPEEDEILANAGIDAIKVFFQEHDH